MKRPTLVVAAMALLVGCGGGSNPPIAVPEVQTVTLSAPTQTIQYAALKVGTGAWTVIDHGTSSLSASVPSDTTAYTIVVVVQPESAAARTYVVSSVPQELSNIVIAAPLTGDVISSVSGQMTNLPEGATARIHGYASSGDITENGGYSLEIVQHEPTDLIGVLQDASGATIGFNARRGLASPPLKLEYDAVADFGLGDSYTLTVAGTSLGSHSARVELQTVNSTTATLRQGSEATLPFHALPSAAAATTDRFHYVAATAASGRYTECNAYGSAANTTLTFPTAAVAPTVSGTGLDLVVQGTLPTGTTLAQLTLGSEVPVVLWATPAALSGTSYQLSLPTLTTLPGWSSVWTPPTPTSWRLRLVDNNQTAGAFFVQPPTSGYEAVYQDFFGNL